jgi:hypothetical protein
MVAHRRLGITVPFKHVSAEHRPERRTSPKGITSASDRFWQQPPALGLVQVSSRLRR